MYNGKIIQKNSQPLTNMVIRKIKSSIKRRVVFENSDLQ